MSSTKVTFAQDHTTEPSSVYVSYGDEPTRPMAIDALSDYPKIHKFVFDEWGTVPLKEYFEKLLSDTRENKRNGFPDEAAEALLMLALANTAYLEKMGFNFEDDAASAFAVTGWKLPKNF